MKKRITIDQLEVVVKCPGCAWQAVAAAGPFWLSYAGSNEFRCPECGVSAKGADRREWFTERPKS